MRCMWEHVEKEKNILLALVTFDMGTRNSVFVFSNFSSGGGGLGVGFTQVITSNFYGIVPALSFRLSS